MRTISFSLNRFLALLCLLNLLFFISYAQYPGQYTVQSKMPVTIPVKAYSFELHDVKLLDGPFKENMKRNGQWLLSISNNRLLHSWRVNAGIITNATAFGGWEKLDVELRGHTLGHVLSGLALMYETTGISSYREKADSLVTALAECQNVLNQNGYLSAFPQYFIDRCIAGQPVWAPWYTLHKVMAGLLDVYLTTNNPVALEIVNKMSYWAYDKLKVLNSNQLSVMKRIEFGGMSEVCYNLYSITGDARQKDLAGMFYDEAVMDPLARQEDKLEKLHANTQIPKMIGAARGFELTGETKQNTIATFFWNTVQEHHTFANGGNSDVELFFGADKLSEHLSPQTTETCNTYNMLKLTRHLFTWTADAKYADYYEQALYNHILASQDPTTGMVSYFMPSKPGLFKVYSTPDNSFWCCVGTGFENHAKYNEAIYYHDDKGIYVNLFIPSELNWKARGVKIIQKTSFPEEPVTHLEIQTPREIEMPVYLRYPKWTSATATVKINGKKVSVSHKPGSYITLNRKWKNGDKIEVTYPMALRMIPTNDNVHKVAFAYGPVLLAGQMGTVGLQNPAPYANDQNDFNNYNVPSDVVSTLMTKGSAITSWLKPSEGQALEFKTIGVAAHEITMIPFYKLHGERYVLYWDLQ